MMVAPAAGLSRSLRSLALAPLGDRPAVRRDAPPKPSGRGVWGVPCALAQAARGSQRSAGRPRPSAELARVRRPASSSTVRARSISRAFLLRLFCSRTRYVPAGEVVPAITAIGAWVVPVPAT
jgi:hypothetical protein